LKHTKKKNRLKQPGKRGEKKGGARYIDVKHSNAAHTLLEEPTFDGKDYSEGKKKKLFSGQRKTELALTGGERRCSKAR